MIAVRAYVDAGNGSLVPVVGLALAILVAAVSSDDRRFYPAPGHHETRCNATQFALALTRHSWQV